MTTQLDPITVSVADAVAISGLSDTRIRALLNEGRVQSGYEGRKRLVYVSSLRAYLEALPTERDTG